MHPLLEKVWMSSGDWPTWEKVVWRLSLVAGGLWVLLGFYGVVVVKPTGYVNTDEFTCSELQKGTKKPSALTILLSAAALASRFMTVMALRSIYARKIS